LAGNGDRLIPAGVVHQDDFVDDASVNFLDGLG
jgi:hypothetical protein